MAKISVKVRSDIGDPGVHVKYGALKPGSTVLIEEEDFGDGLFERPAADLLSPHEQADKDRAAAEGRTIGAFAPPPEPPAKPAKKNESEVSANA